MRCQEHSATWPDSVHRARRTASNKALVTTAIRLQVIQNAAARISYQEVPCRILSADVIPATPTLKWPFGAISPRNLLCNYRQDAAKRQTAGIKSIHRPKTRFSPRMQGDSLHRFMSNLAGPTGTWVRLAAQNFASIGAGGGNAAPKYQKIQFLERVASQRRAL